MAISILNILKLYTILLEIKFPTIWYKFHAHIHANKSNRTINSTMNKGNGW